MGSVVISFKTPIGAVGRNNRLITKDVWNAALKEYNDTHTTRPLSVCYADIHRLSTHPDQYFEISPEAVVGTISTINDENATVEIRSEARCEFISELVSEHGFRLEPRGYYSTKKGIDGKDTVDFIKLTCFDLVH